MSKAEEGAYKAYPYNGDYRGQGDSNSKFREAYINGYHQAEKDVIDNLWHDPDEVPEIERKIIFESETFLGKYLGGEWNQKKDVFGKKERWCYLTDILPSKSWNGERPYSRVDYFKGYEQAEKDNKLTWKDMVLLRTSFDATDVNIRLGSIKIQPMTKEYYQEVLKRFKEKRRRV